MIRLTIEGQKLKCQKPMIVSDTVNYIEAECTFSEDWNDVHKYIHFTQDEQTYDLQFANDKITADMGLNLTEGYWEVSVHGEIVEGDEIVKRITTNPIDLYVVQSGVIDGEPFPTITASVGEQYVDRMQELLDNAGIDDIKEDITDIKEQIEHGVKVDAYTKAESDAKYQPVGNYATQTDLDKKMEYYIVKGENVSGHIVLTKDGVAQTYDMLKSAFDDDKLFLYLIYDYHIYIPSIDVSNGILFTSASIYREPDDTLYAETDRILVKIDNSIDTAHTTSELLGNKTPEMPLDIMGDLSDEEKAQYYPSIGAVEQYVGEYFNNAMTSSTGTVWTEAEKKAALLKMGCTVDSNGFVKFI